MLYELTHTGAGNGHDLFIHSVKKNPESAITHIRADCEQTNALGKVYAEENCFSFLSIAVKANNHSTVYYTRSLFTSGVLHTVNSEQKSSYIDDLQKITIKEWKCHLASNGKLST